MMRRIRGDESRWCMCVTESEQKVKDVGWGRM